MTRQPVMQATELQDFLDEIFPQQAGVFRVETVGPMTTRLRQPVVYENLRPGGSVSGPTMFALADCAFYAAVLAMIGRQAMCVTSNLNITFLRRPPVADLIGEARILKLGRSLASGDVLIHSEGVDGAVAHAAVTYALPSER